MPEVNIVVTETIFGRTVREIERVGESAPIAHSWTLRVAATLEEAPSYWSMRRDNWMVDFVKRAGNDLLAGAMSTLVAKVVSTGFYIEGPLALAEMAMDMVLNQMGFGAGWDVEVSKWTQGFLNRDAGGVLENLRASATDHEGPSMGFAHLDESKCRPTKDPEYPIIYMNKKRGPIKMHRSQVTRLIDTSEPRDKYRGIGFCSVSRALATALILMDLVRYKRERLSDLPPAGILLLNNLTEAQWRDIITNYDARQHNQGNTTWRDIMVACGYDPSFPISAELFETSALPEHYDERVATEIAIYTFALAFRVDPREYWPVSAGPLGTATEASIQDKKAKAKGEGIIFSNIERLLNGPFGLPPLVKLRFDYRDDEEDMMAAEIAGRKIGNVRKMWEASPNAAELGGMIDRDEARAILVREGLVPPDVLGVSVDIDRIYDTRAYGPWVRLYRDGRRHLLERATQAYWACVDI